MSKYIDAEKLKRFVGELKAQAQRNCCDSWGIVPDALEEVEGFIDSLQQEQPAKRGYKDCNGCEYNRLLKDQIGWQFRGCFCGDYKGKPIAEIELCPLKVAQQEQPEVELEKEIERVVEEEEKFMKFQVRSQLIKYVARHFYKLGVMARKEE